MKTISEIDFPENPIEHEGWTRTVKRQALAHNILVVATTRREGKWSAYISAVPGVNHDDEWEEVLRHGTKILETLASVLFPRFAGIPYAR